MGNRERVACQLFRAYPPRERWVGDAAAYNRSDVRQRLAFLYIPLREKWVGDVMACVVRLGLSRARQATTSHTHFSRSGYAET